MLLSTIVIVLSLHHDVYGRGNNILLILVIIFYFCFIIILSHCYIFYYDKILLCIVVVVGYGDVLSLLQWQWEREARRLRNLRFGVPYILRFLMNFELKQLYKNMQYFYLKLFCRILQIQWPSDALVRRSVAVLRSCVQRTTTLAVHQIQNTLQQYVRLYGLYSVSK